MRFSLFEIYFGGFVLSTPFTISCYMDRASYHDPLYKLTYGLFFAIIAWPVTVPYYVFKEVGKNKN